MSFSLRRLAAVLTLAVLLAPGLAQAAPRFPARRLADRGFLSLLWHVLVSPWLKNGAEVDPNGRTGAAPAGGGAVSDNGAELDPNGRT
ncbi:MAG TPA: hypothetical protein VKK31_02570 [Thermoanaerobaculia bacterium]|nr:hypothetical protein [Thermoanaerobaculia bacterium]